MNIKNLDLDLITKYCNEGLSCREISKLSNVDRCTIYSFVRKNKLPFFYPSTYKRDYSELPNEIWKDIPEFEKLYQISNFGRLRILYGRCKNSMSYGSIKKGGYLHFALYKNKKYYKYMAHRLVALAFIPNPNNYPQVNHIDRNRKNNNLNNLEWCNAHQNAKHKLISKDHNLKFTMTDINNMYKLHLENKTITEIASIYNIKSVAVVSTLLGYMHPEY